jgi:hypothetical protein
MSSVAVGSTGPPGKLWSATPSPTIGSPGEIEEGGFSGGGTGTLLEGIGGSGPPSLVNGS